MHVAPVPRLVPALLAVALAALPWAGAAPRPLAQDHTVVAHNPDHSLYIEGCGLVRLAGRTLVAVVPLVPRGERAAERRSSASRTRILLSRDAGSTWSEQAQLPYYSAVPWVHDGALYLFGMKGGTTHRNDDLLLLRSTDAGRTWSAPVTLATGHFWNCQTGMVIRGGKIYWAVDDLSLGMTDRGPRIVRGDLTGDIMAAASWRLSNPVAFPGVPDALTHPQFAASSSQYLEPNVVEVQGRIRVLTTVKPKRQTTTGLAGILDLAEQGSDLTLTFTQYHPVPGAQLKFCVVWDDRSKLFWAAMNLPADAQMVSPWWQPLKDKAKSPDAARVAQGGNDRRTLFLHYSLDALNWFPAGCLVQAPKMSQSFMYPALVIDGDDLAMICRTAKAAPDQHDADFATFHRVARFRDLALNLVPAPEQ